MSQSNKKKPSSSSSNTSCEDTPSQPKRNVCPGYESNLSQNWNGNVQFAPSHIHIPSTVKELCQVVKKSKGPIKVVGRGHSFTPLAQCTNGTLISLQKLNQISNYVPPTKKASKKRINNGMMYNEVASYLSFSPSVQNVKGSITIQGGTTYTEVAQFLTQSKGNNAGRGALRNLPSCPQFTVAGAIATATHGSGVHHLNLAADVSAIEFVTADGTLVKYSREEDGDLVQKCRIHLGCLGVISSLTLDIVPYFEVVSYRYDDVKLEYMVENLEQMYRACDSLSVWTSGFGKGQGKGYCWVVYRYFLSEAQEEESTEFSSIRRRFHKKENQEKSGVQCDVAINRYCTDPRNNPMTFHHSGRKPWYDGLTLTMNNCIETSMTIVDLQAEFFVPITYASQALQAVWDVSHNWTFSSPWGHVERCFRKGKKVKAQKGLVDAMEFRQVKGGDGGWLSPHAVDSLGIHISFNGDVTLRQIIKEKVAELEDALRKSVGVEHVRAHWGKLAPKTFEGENIRRLYGNGLECFKELCRVHDPSGKFLNEHLRDMLSMKEEDEDMQPVRSKL